MSLIFIKTAKIRLIKTIQFITRNYALKIAKNRAKPEV